MACDETRRASRRSHVTLLLVCHCVLSVYCVMLDVKRQNLLICHCIKIWQSALSPRV